jgi:mannose/fructose/N-acetylgalactosamine-specific phosphotransferase system component IID
MYIVPIAWMFVVVLMTIAEATSTQGTVLGAFFTFLLYGLLPLSIVMYVLGTPGRRRARRAAEAAEAAADAAAEAAQASAAQRDAGGHAAGDR